MQQSDGLDNGQAESSCSCQGLAVPTCAGPLNVHRGNPPAVTGGRLCIACQRPPDETVILPHPLYL